MTFCGIFNCFYLGWMGAEREGGREFARDGYVRYVPVIRYQVLSHHSSLTRRLGAGDAVAKVC